MNLVNELRERSNGIEYIKMQVIEEIKRAFDKCFEGDRFENHLRKIISKSDVEERKKDLFVEFWEYQDGCSTTHFHCGGIEWYNHENKDGYASHRYKGIELNTIDKEVGAYLSQLLTNKMTELGFTLLSCEPVKSRFSYYYKKFTFGW